MNREIFRYMAHTYGRSPAYLYGLAAEFIRTMLTRVVVVIIVAQLAANLAGHHLAQARTDVYLYLLANLIALIIGATGELMSYKAENAIYGRLANDYHDKLISKDMAFYRDNPGGYLVSLFRQHLDGLLQLCRFIRKDLLRTFISLVFPAAILTIYNWKIGLVAFAIVTLQVIYIIWASVKVNVLRQATHEIYRQITAEVADEITNIVAFKSSGAEQQASSHLKSMMDQETKTFNKRYSMSTYLDMPRELLTFLAIGFAFYLVSNGGSSSAKTVSAIVLTITYMFQINRSVGDLPAIVQNYDDILTKIHPTLAYLNNDDQVIHDVGEPVKLQIKHGAIDIQNLNFGYQSPGDKSRQIKVFDNFSLTIRPGEHIGIVGLSGAGKSTLANLIMRFDEIVSGTIKIDGTDIRHVAQQDLRRQIAYVPQEPLLFHRSIKHNIAYYNNEATQKDIQNAAKTAHAHHFIMELPDGYDSMVGDRGVKLSGGQKQRVAIARAILKDSPIMIFDEATSALDSESEKIIQQALPKIVGKQTAIVIAHRLSTIQHMDRIAVLEKGKITQLGSHKELMKDDKGLYARLWAHQSQHGILDPSLEE